MGTFYNVGLIRVNRNIYARNLLHQGFESGFQIPDYTFPLKQSEVDYSKNIWKEKNRGHGFVCLLVGYISVKKKIEIFNSIGAGAHKLGKSS